VSLLKNGFWDAMGKSDRAGSLKQTAILPERRRENFARLKSAHARKFFERVPSEGEETRVLAHHHQRKRHHSERRATCGEANGYARDLPALAPTRASARSTPPRRPIFSPFFQAGVGGGPFVGPRASSSRAPDDPLHSPLEQGANLTLPLTSISPVATEAPLTVTP
jgi:hypothetical protein